MLTDLIREVKPPFNPESVVAELVEVLRSYRIRDVAGDRYRLDDASACLDPQDLRCGRRSRQHLKNAMCRPRAVPPPDRGFLHSGDEVAVENQSR